MYMKMLMNTPLFKAMALAFSDHICFAHNSYRSDYKRKSVRKQEETISRQLKRNGTRLQREALGINSTNSVVIPQSLVVRSIVLG